MSGYGAPPRTSSPSVCRRKQDRLLDVYKVALDEYRFQVNLNWSRTQYFLVLNLALLTVGIGLIGRTEPSRLLVAAVFSVGGVFCLACLAALHVQTAYYRTARNRIVDLERALGFPVEQQLQTTPGLRGASRRFGNVRSITSSLLLAVWVFDVVGLLVTAFADFRP